MYDEQPSEVPQQFGAKKPNDTYQYQDASTAQSRRYVPPRDKSPYNKGRAPVNNTYQRYQGEPESYTQQPDETGDPRYPPTDLESYYDEPVMSEPIQPYDNQFYPAQNPKSQTTRKPGLTPMGYEDPADFEDTDEQFQRKRKPKKSKEIFNVEVEPVPKHSPYRKQVPHRTPKALVDQSLGSSVGMIDYDQGPP